MTREEKQKAIDALKISAPVRAMTQEEFNDYILTINQIMDWLEQQPCDDAISRQAVLDILKDKWNMFSDANDAMQESIDTIKSLRPVTPQQKVGHWIDSSNGWMCSECKRDSTKDTKYCPNCGAKMEEVKE